MAGELFKHLRKKGYDLPEDAGIIGAGNLRLTEHMDPPLTTIEYHEREMGRIGMRMLLEKINGQTKKTQSFLDPEPVIRATCMPAGPKRSRPHHGMCCLVE